MNHLETFRMPEIYGAMSTKKWGQAPLEGHSVPGDRE